MKKSLLTVLTFSSGLTFAQDCAKIFISEYVEGWSNNKALEIYNPTSAPIDLSQYFVARYSNGSTTATGANAIQLSGTIAPYDVFVAVLDKRDPNGTGQEAPIWDSLNVRGDGFYCPVYNTSNAFYWNGNDAVMLAKGNLPADPALLINATNVPNFAIIDIFGKIGENPANETGTSAGNDEKGRLIHTLETFQGTERRDSLENFYIYNEKNLLIQHRKKEYKGFTCIVNEYDDKNRIIKQIYKRDVLNDRDEVIQSFLINEETMKYENSKLEEKQIVFNNYNLPYMEITRTYDINNYLIQLKEQYITTSNFYRTEFSYNEHGWLESKKKYIGSENQSVEELRFKYDSFGNVTNIFNYSINELKEEKEIYYNDKTLILNNILIIDPKTKRVQILQFKEKSFYK